MTTFLGFGANEARARHHRKLFLAGLLRFRASHYSHYPDHVSISPSLTSTFSSLSSCTSQRRCSSRAGRRPPTKRPLSTSWHERQHQVGGFVVRIINLTFSICSLSFDLPSLRLPRPDLLPAIKDSQIVHFYGTGWSSHWGMPIPPDVDRPSLMFTCGKGRKIILTHKMVSDLLEERTFKDHFAGQLYSQYEPAWC